MRRIYFFLFCWQAIILSAQVQVSTLGNEFNGSGGVKIGPDGKVYIADFGQSLQNANGTQVWVLDPSTGIRQEFATGLSGASGNDFDSQGNLFQSNIGNSTISKISPQGNVSLFTAVGISGPVGIVIDEADNLYVCNCSNNTIRKVSPQAVSTPFASHPEFSCPNGITMDEAGFFYMSNFGDGKVFKIDSLGNATVFTTIPGNNNGHLTYSPADSMLYLASHGASRIYRLALDGTFTILAGNGVRGNQDGPAQFAAFSRPNGVAISQTGDTIYVNSSIPLSNNGFPLNPSVLRMITGVNPASVGIDETLDRLKLSLFPNPTTTQLNLSLDVRQAGKLYYSLYNMAGQAVLAGQIPLQAGAQTQTIPWEDHCLNGSYWLELRFHGQRLSKMIQILR